MIRGGLLLMLALLTGNALSQWSGLPIPGALVGLVLLLLLLRVRPATTGAVSRAAPPLLRHLSLFFVPPLTLAVLASNLAPGDWARLLATVALSTLVTIPATALTLRWALNRQRAKP